LKSAIQSKKIHSIGHIDSIRRINNVLEVNGWVASFDGDQVTNFFINFSEREFVEVESFEILPSPDVKEVHPKLRFADKCRFKINIVLPSFVSTEHLNNSLIELVPVFMEHRGNCLVGMLQDSVINPPDEEVNIIGSGWQVGSSFMGYFINIIQLDASARILDVGCGVGRIAYPLTRFLSKNSKYEGFDIYESGINWAIENISSRYHNFHFQKIDIFNKQYNPKGKLKAGEVLFPYEKGNFDFVYLTSVFTHMYASDVKHYLNEIYRVLKANGKCLLTCFLLNNESSYSIRNNRSSQKLIYELGESYTVDKRVPETAIGFQEDLFLKWIANSGFVLESKHYGNWCDRDLYTSYQDILVLRKDG
jgi:SAM-dependent methyltransferase